MTELKGDQIFNGAVDNASGVAGLLETGASIHESRKRNGHYCSWPPPPKKLACSARNITRNIRFIRSKKRSPTSISTSSTSGEKRAIFRTPALASRLWTTCSPTLRKRMGRTAVPNPRPRKDLSIAPIISNSPRSACLRSTSARVNIYFRERENAPLRSDEFDLKDYHQVSDEIHPDWDLSGAVQDVRLLFEVGYQVANADKYPEWKSENEFKPKRDAMLGKDSK